MRPIASIPSRTRPAGRTAARGVGGPLLVWAVAAFARPVALPPEPGRLEPEPTAVVAQRAAVSLDQAIALASRRYPGRVVRAETTSNDGRRIHEIRILVEGEGDPRMRIVRIDADSGRFL